MTDYTPTTEEVRQAYQFCAIADDSDSSHKAIPEFDRWLDEVKADAWDEGWLHNVDDRIWSSLHDNPYREVD